MLTEKILKRISLMTGVSLLIMAVIAPIALFMGLNPVYVTNDAAQTLNNLLGANNPLGWIGVLFIVTVLLDVFISWGVYMIFKGENQPLAVLTAWIRLLYSGILSMATVPMFMASKMVQTVPTMNGQTDTQQVAVQVLQQLDTFKMTWDVGLVLFGVHLVLLGVLIFRSRQFNKILGILVSLAGSAYFIDSLGKFLVTDYGLSLASYLFFGEVLFIGWLIWRGIVGFKAA